MKVSQKDTEKLMMMNLGTPNAGSGPQSRVLPRLLLWLILFVTVTYVVYTLRLISNSRACDHEPFSNPRRQISTTSASSQPTQSILDQDQAVEVRRQTTQIRNVVFGIAASAKFWEKRKNYIKLWFKPEEMRGIVWLDQTVKKNKTKDNKGDRVAVEEAEDLSLPPVMISGDTSKFSYTNRQGHRSAIRISRIVSETLRLGLEDVHWFVMGDDDTVFVTENLVRVLSKYDHNQYYYIGSLSESHLQNIYFSYGMAYGGGGFAISYPLAKALEKMQDRCIQRYPGLYGSDDRMQACMAELGVPLTKELGFHQVCFSVSSFRFRRWFGWFWFCFFSFRWFFFAFLASGFFVNFFNVWSYRRYFGLKEYRRRVVESRTIVYRLVISRPHNIGV